ncbi:MAG: dTMP kinase [Candidatus Zixiibacteriota bacterium]|nr:MAG: dTMP kinase [candidate division Zixibacteria bacterium]
MAGLLITLEGIDSCGKTTQARKLASYLRKRGYGVLLTREPGGDRIAEKVRRILLSKTNSEMTDLTELLLYQASRSQLTERTIRPALRAGRVVICDRYSDSSLAYQGYGRGLSKIVIKQLNRIASLGIVPDLTILIDVPVRTSLERKRKEKTGRDRLEKERFEFHRRIGEGFLAIARQNRRRIKVVDGREDIERTWRKVRKVVDAFLGKSDSTRKRPRR